MKLVAKKAKKFCTDFEKRNPEFRLSLANKTVAVTSDVS
jgi:hypothetical protein